MDNVKVGVSISVSFIALFFSTASLSQQSRHTAWLEDGLFDVPVNPEKDVYSIRSKMFRIEKSFLNFKIYGAYNPFRTSLNLWCNDVIVKSTTGSDNREWRSISWDVRDFKGADVCLEIVDAEPSEGSDVRVSQIIQQEKATGLIIGDVKEEIERAKKQAMDSIENNISKAASDPNRPIYHFAPISQRMNDPNGFFYENGYYHLFYQYNPVADRGGSGYKIWGHARSRNLIQWEHRPILWWPDWERGELQCFSGGAFKTYSGKVMMFYTRVSAPGIPRTQEAMVPLDDDYDAWEKYTDTSLLPYLPNNGPDPGHLWRDPFVFKEDGQTFMLLCTDNGVALYEAGGDKLMSWNFKSIIYETKNGAPECPNLFKLGDKWILLISPQGPVEYMVGIFDPLRGTFDVEKRGLLNTNAQFYATQGFYDHSQNRLLLTAFIKGFKNGKGWRDCAVLPRMLSLSADGLPLQLPIPELTELRGRRTEVKKVLINGAASFPSLSGNVMELDFKLDVGKSGSAGIRLLCSEDGKEGFEIRYEKGKLLLPNSTRPPQKLVLVDNQLHLRIFIDKGAIEVFSHDGSLAETRVFYTHENNTSVDVFSEGEAELLHLIKWEIEPVMHTSNAMVKTSKN